MRGSPHAHCVMWMKNAPRYRIDPDDKVCEYINKYISCKMPSEEGLLKNLVKEVQTHSHSTYCKRSGKCRFHFPRVPSSKTLIASQPDSGDCNNQEIKQCMDKVRKLLVEVKQMSQLKN